MATALKEIKALGTQVIALFGLDPRLKVTQIYHQAMDKLRLMVDEKKEDVSQHLDLMGKFESAAKAGNYPLTLPEDTVAKANGKAKKEKEAKESKALVVKKEEPPPLTSEEKTVFTGRLEEIGQELVARRQTRGVELTTWLVGDAGLLVEAKTIQERLDPKLGTKSFWAWAAERLGYTEAFIRMIFHVRNSLADWEGPLPPISMGQIVELNRLPERDFKAVLKGDLSFEGKRYDELPIRSTDETVPSLRKFVVHLSNVWRQEEAEAKKLEAATSGKGGKGKSSKTPAQKALAASKKGTPSAPKRGYAARDVKRDLGTDLWNQATDFSENWDSRKKSVVDALEKGEISDEGKENLRSLVQLAKEIVGAFDGKLS